MNQERLVSVIVPIYNVELYLPRCINSIINQTYKNLEVLLVDDGSPDESGKIADEYASRDRRITVFHKENGGLSDARNFALERMSGDFVTFIDSDDFVDLRYIEVLVGLLENSNVNVSMVGCQTFEDDSQTTQYDGQPFESVVYSEDDALNRALKVELRQSAWGKLYRKQLFNELRFPKGLLYEDLAIFFDVIDKSNGIVYTPLPLYKYFVRAESIMQQPFKLQQMDELRIIDIVMDKLETKRPDLHNMIQSRKVYSYLLVLGRILSSDNKTVFAAQKDEVEKKIKYFGKAILLDYNVKMSWKIRLFSLYIGDSCFYMVNTIMNYMLRKHK